MIPPIPAPVQDAYQRAMQSVIFDQCSVYDRAAIERYVTELEIRLEILTGDPRLNADAVERERLGERYYLLGIEAYGISLGQYQGAPNACECLIEGLKNRLAEQLAEHNRVERVAEDVERLPRRNGQAYEALHHRRFPNSSAQFKPEEQS